MQRSKSIVGIAVGVSSIVLIVAGVIAHRSVQLLADTSDEILRSKELELSLERLLSSVRDAETGQRGYLLTGSVLYLFPYDEALRQIEGRLHTLEERMQARDGSLQELQVLNGLVKSKLDETARTLELARSGRRVEALALVNTDQGKAAMEALRTLIAERVLVEQRNVERLMTLEQDARQATLRSSISVSALAVVLMILLAYVVRRDSARLRLSEERLMTTLRSIGDAVIATDEQGTVTMINPIAENLTGWPQALARGKPLDEIFRIVNERTRATVESPVTKVLRKGGIVGIANHTVLIHKAGHETAIEDSGAPICDDAGTVTGVVLVFRDATEERAAQNALRLADQRKDEFLATLAHELRNPLAPIRQAAAVAGHAGSKPEQVRWSHSVIERQAAHMARLLDDLLDVSRITRGRLEVRRARVALRNVVDAAVETARPAIDAGKHALLVNLPDEPLMLDVDALRISQVLSNLLTNAAKYSAHPGTIRLIAERVGEDVVIRVADDGIGVAPADLPRIFEMFAQVKPTLDRKEAGLGIGLALSKALVELHGGTLGGSSAGLGKGSEFTVRLQLAKPEQAMPTPGSLAETADATPGASRLRILLADDNRDACDSLEMLLGIEGHEVRVAYDGDSALATLADFHPEVALLDIGMPKMNGYELATEIRKQPWSQNIQLVAVTGWGQGSDRQRALDAGFDAHFVKPVDFTELRSFCASIAAGRSPGA
jgi:PAS domain S-box-containing protein